MEKERLLEEIERLLGFDGEKASINPDYLEYFTVEELESIKKGLQKKYETMVEENLEWMQRFRKER